MPTRLPQHAVHRALDAARNGIVICDAHDDYPVVYVNPAFCELTGYSAEEVVGRNCRLLQGPETDPAAVRRISEALAAGEECRVVLRNRRKDGSLFWNQLTISPVRDADGQVVQVIGVQDDVTEAREANDRVRWLADHDALTGLLNRAALARALEAEAAAGRPFVLLFCDLDGFKDVNDALGHFAGDELLSGVAERLRGVVRPGDLVGRQGGDELVVALRDVEDDPDAVAAHVARRIAEAIDAPFQLTGAQASARLSVGVAAFPRDAASVAGVLRQADQAMYAAKRRRSGSVVSAAEVRPATPRADAAGTPAGGTANLDALLGGRPVRSVYQPIVELSSRRVVGFEALARGPEGTDLERPDLLFAAARAAGLEPELDWACRVAAVDGALRAGMPSPLRLFVNVEPSTLGTACPPHLASRWEAAGRDLDVVLEITERALTARPADLLRLVEGVRARGWSVALDDVGADSRSLALMPLLRPDVIKLDLRLVQQRPSADVAEIVNAVAAHRERMGGVVLAEGIETEAHVDMAFAMGATHGQGWLFGRPGELAVGERDLAELPVASPPAATPGATPFEVVARRLPVRRATKPLLLAISHALEAQGRRQDSGGVVLGAFQTDERFTPATRKRYAGMAQRAALVGAFGIGLPDTPAPGVRGAAVPDDDPLKDEWSVVVLGPHFAGALVAVDLGDDGPDEERRFDFALTYDRDLVVDAGNALMGRIEPLA